MTADLVSSTGRERAGGWPQSLDGLVRPLERKRDLRPWLAALLSIVLLAWTFLQISKAPPQAFADIPQLGWLFWTTFGLLYVAQPLSELVIFARLWRLPLSGFGILLRKGVINEIVFGYSGEVYFYLWARGKAGLANAPFGAIKDVNILSAVMGNVLTLVMLGVSAQGLGRVELSRYLGPALWSGVAIVGLSLAILIFARRVFTLRREHLAFVAGVHVLRLVMTSALTVVLWRTALPDVALDVWLVLLTLRLLLARLPFLANKDLVFSTLVLALFGASSPAAVLLATLAIMTLMAHLGVLGILGAQDLLRLVRKS